MQAPHEVLDAYRNDYQAGQFTIVLADDRQSTDVSIPDNVETEPLEKEGLYPSQSTPVPLDSSSPAPGKGTSGLKRQRVACGGGLR